MIFYKTFFLLSFLFITQIKASSVASAEKSIEEALTGKKSFYGLAVTKKEPDYNLGYEANDQEFIFAILDFLLNNDELLFRQKISPLFLIYKNQYLSLVNEIKKINDTTGKTIKETKIKEIIKQKIQTIMNGIFNFNDEIVNKIYNHINNGNLDVDKITDFFSSVVGVSDKFVEEFNKLNDDNFYNLQKNQIKKIKDCNLSIFVLKALHTINHELLKELSLQNQKSLTSAYLKTTDVQDKLGSMLKDIDKINIYPDIKQSVFGNKPKDKIFFDKYEAKIGLEAKSINDLSESNFDDLCLKYEKQFINTIVQKSMGMQQELKNQVTLVVFNEMFFSKNIPLVLQQYVQIKNNIEQLTKKNPLLLLHVNFLYKMENKPKGKKGLESLFDWSDKHYKKDWEYSNFKKLQDLNSEKPLFISDSYDQSLKCLEDYKDYLRKQMKNNTRLDLFKNYNDFLKEGMKSVNPPEFLKNYNNYLNKCMKSVKPQESLENYKDYLNKCIENSQAQESLENYNNCLNECMENSEFLLKNTSTIYWFGEEIIEYTKSTYRNEADSDIKDGKAYYVFGDGEDKINPLLHLGKVKYYDHKKVADIVNKYLSTEICYDLEFGIRKKLNNYPENGKIHIVTSNTLCIDEILEANLPESMPVFHVDPEHTEIVNNRSERITNKDIQMKIPLVFSDINFYLFPILPYLSTKQQSQ